MAKPKESRRFAPGVPRSCLSRIGTPKKQFATAAEAAAHCFSKKRYIYQCGEGHWHIATYREER